MQRLLPACLIVLVLAVRPAWGHPMPNSSVALRLHQAGIDAVVTLPVAELASVWERPLPADAAQAIRDYGPALAAYLRAHVRPVAPDGRPWSVEVREMIPVAEAIPDVRVLLTMTPPPDAPVDRLTLVYDAITHHLVTHLVVVSLAEDWRNGLVQGRPIILGTLRDSATSLPIDRSGGSWIRGFAAMLRLGARHIAEGTDHLLFLLALILPAPLVASGGRWVGPAGARVTLGRITRIVTAFTLGHSLTLVLGVWGGLRTPEGPVEAAIALSILVAAVHALVPILRGREVVVAAGFGLVHGLAFAAALADLSLDPWALAASLLGFNLGIEAFQILVVLATLPWLILLAHAPIYRALRVMGAVLTGVAALAWLADRVSGQTNPVVPLVEEVAAHALWLLAALIALTLVAAIAARRGEPRSA